VRLVQVTIPAGKSDTLLAALDDEDIHYVVSDEVSGREFDAIAYIPLPTNAVEPVLELLRTAGLDEDAYTVVLNANTVISDRFDELKAEYSEDINEVRIAREELVAAAADLAPSTRNYVIMTVVSALIATAGLLLDSPAVVVGSMVIAPLVGPALAASVGTVVEDREMFHRGVSLQILGLLVAVGAAFVFAFLVRYLNLVPPVEDVTVLPEVSKRVAPDFLSLVIAIGAGVAGIISLTTGVSTALVGVMIAVALIPPAATVGIGLAWGQLFVSLGAAVLVLVNVLSINLAALVVLWYRGYRPEHWFRRSDARKTTVTRIAILISAIVVLSAFLGGVTFDSFQRATTEQAIHDDAEAAVEAFNTSQDIHLVDVNVIYPRSVPFQNPRQVVVIVGVPPGEFVSGLAPAMRSSIRQTAGADVNVEVRYIQIEKG